MKIKEILSTFDHRPWDMPATAWRYYQEWNNTVFLHWPVKPEHLRPLVPSDLEVDTIDGNAWISIVAFSMEQIRPRGIMAFPPISNFPELNVRTYVRYQGKSGVHFLSIEGGKWLSCFLANKLSALPYRYSKMQLSKDSFSSSNTVNQDSISFQYRVGKAHNKKSATDIWLTERYALFQDYKTDIHAFELHHLPWQLKEVELSNLTFDYPRFKQLVKGQPALAHFSPGVQVVSWEKKARPGHTFQS